MLVEEGVHLLNQALPYQLLQHHCGALKVLSMLLATVAQAIVVAVACVVQVAVDWITDIVEQDEGATVEHRLHDPKILSPLKIVCVSIQPDQIALGALVVIVLGP